MTVNDFWKNWISLLTQGDRPTGINYFFSIEFYSFYKIKKEETLSENPSKSQSKKRV